MKKALVASMVLFVFFGFIKMVAAETAFDPQLLVGEWKGLWSNQFGSDSFYMTIKKVEGEKVYGMVYTQGPAQYHNIDRPFIGTIDLKNMNLSGTSAKSTFSFTIVNIQRMEGWGTATIRSDIWVEKTKTK